MNLNAEITIEKIGPPRANELLQTTTDGQRKIHQRYVQKLAAEMVQGQWHLSPDCIVLLDGRLANGQHRLSAVIVSGRTEPFLVMKSKDKTIFEIIDSGIKRSVGDVAHQLGMIYTTQVAAASRLVLSYNKKIITIRSIEGGHATLGVLSRQETVIFMKDNIQELSENAIFVQKIRGSNKLISPTLMIALLQIAGSENKEKTLEFLQSLVNGSTVDDMPHELREKFIKNGISKAKLPPVYLFGLMIKAFRAHIRGEKLSVLKMIDGEEFPRL